MSCPFDIHIERKEQEKCIYYSELKLKKIEIIPVEIGAFGTVTKHFEKWIEKLELNLTIEALRKHYLLGTTTY